MIGTAAPANGNGNGNGNRNGVMYHRAADRRSHCSRSRSRSTVRAEFLKSVDSVSRQIF